MDKKIIVIEGFDGSGKTTQVQLLGKTLPQFKTTKFPEYDTYSGKRVSEYLKGKFDNYRKSDLFKTDKDFAYFASSLYTMNRLEFFSSDRFDKDASYIFDRYTTSNILFNSMLLSDKNLIDEYIKYLEFLEYDVYGFPRPTSTYFLSIPMEVTLNNIEKRNTTSDKYEQIEYLKRLYDIKDYIIDKLKWTVVDCVDEDGEMLPAIHVASFIVKSEFK